jgi:outer membrane lipoprotein LolB
LALTLTLTCVLLGCASPVATRTVPSEQHQWAGRLSLKIATTPVQSFTAGFELTGSPDNGLLKLTSPLGITLARAQWTPGEASLQAQGENKRFTSVEEMIADATGTPIPLQALFYWLDGVQAPVNGWTADLSVVNQGKLTANRLWPEPKAELRLILEH